MDDHKVLVMAVACKVLDYKRQNPSAELEQIMGYAIRGLKGDEMFKLKAIAVIDRVIKYKQKNTPDKVVIQKLMSELDQIFGGINPLDSE